MIYGARIRLRAIERQDISRFQAWINDPEVRVGISLYLPVSSFEEARWYEQMMERPAYEHPLALEVQEDEAWVLIGDCGLFGFDWRARSAELGILIGDKTRWNQGYGTEATRLILTHAFETLNLRRVFLRVFADNPRAVRTYEKAGFVHEGRLRQAAYHAGAYHDVILMGVLRSEWTPGAGGQADTA